ncbi:MAG TPA: response regulator [Clostridia bacterium]|nr:response regulator [Clostridia bacterium]
MFKILIAEDEDIIRKGLICTIDWLSIGCTVVAEASNGLEGLEMIEKYKPDIVIADIRMPKIDGLEMIQLALRRHNFESIILTGYSEFEYAKRAINLRVFDYILKPVDEEILLETIEKLKKSIEEKRIYNSIMQKIKLKNESDLIDSIFYTKENINYYVKQTLHYIKERYNQKINIKSIADELGVSPSYLSRKLKEVTSQTFLEILNKYRVYKAAELLKTGKYKVYEVAYIVGFSDYKQFYEVFKKYTKIAPTNFLKEGILKIKSVK